MNYWKYALLVDETANAMKRLDWLYFDLTYCTYDTTREIIQLKIEDIYLTMSERFCGLSDEQIEDICLTASEEYCNRTAEPDYIHFANEFMSHLFIPWEDSIPTT